MRRVRIPERAAHLWRVRAARASADRLASFAPDFRLWRRDLRHRPARPPAWPRRSRPAGRAPRPSKIVLTLHSPNELAPARAERALNLEVPITFWSVRRAWCRRLCLQPQLSHEIALADRHAASAQDVVGGRRVEIEIRQREGEEEPRAGEVPFVV